MSASYHVEYAKSNRAACKGCKNRVDKGALRIGTTVVLDYAMTSWTHLECFKRPAHLALSEIDGIYELDSEDVTGLNDWYTEPVAYARKRKAERVAQAVADADVSADAAPPSTPPSKKSRTTPSKSTPEKAAAVQGEAARQQVYEELFGGLPVEQLKACLRANEQLLGGNKAELIERCVDRKLYGNLPRCAQCGIGRLRVSYAAPLGHGGQGRFTCPGGYDDDEYVRCTYRAQSAARPPWSETGHEAYTKPPRKSTGGGKSAVGGTSAVRGTSAVSGASAAGSASASGGTSASGGADTAGAPAVDADGCIVVD